MQAVAYYNEIDPFAAQWLRNLIDAGHIARGVVDTRSIEDVRPSDLRGFTQCHFFAGIGVWSHALRLAGVPDDRPVWTGSCPCQPFSAAGKGSGFDDERHLWPHFHWLIQECRPAAVFGEQVASADAGPWLDLVQTDLEGLGYSFGAVPFPSAGVGAPHIRDRLFWVADAPGQRLEGLGLGRGSRSGRQGSTAQRGGANGRLADANDHGRAAAPGPGVHHAQPDAEPCGGAGGVGHSDSNRAGWNSGAVRGQVTGCDREHRADDAGAPGADGGVANAQHDGHHRQADDAAQPVGNWSQDRLLDRGPGGLRDAMPGPTNGFWADADWLLCRDGKWRPVEPGTFPLAHGVANRVGRLRAYGNAINAQAAAAFVRAAA